MSSQPAAQDIVAVVADAKRRFSELALFSFLCDERYSPAERMLWVPAFAPLAMIFGDLWEHYIRREPSDDPVQQLINRHTHEDAPHRYWYPVDVENLQLGADAGFSDSVRFLWGKRTARTRRAAMDIAVAIPTSEPIVLLATVAAIEATVQVCIPITTDVTERLRASTGARYPYWGKSHLSVDGDHSTTSEMDDLLRTFPYTPAQRARALEAVARTFDAFTATFDEMYEFALAQIERQRSGMPLMPGPPNADRRSAAMSFASANAPLPF